MAMHLLSSRLEDQTVDGILESKHRTVGVLDISMLDIRSSLHLCTPIG
jgi:hypothetical protein